MIWSKKKEIKPKRPYPHFVVQEIRATKDGQIVRLEAFEREGEPVDRKHCCGANELCPERRGIFEFAAIGDIFKLQLSEGQPPTKL